MLPKSLVAAHASRFHAGFHMDYSEKAGAAFYQTLFGQRPGGACAAVHVTARGFLDKPTPPQQQLRPHSAEQGFAAPSLFAPPPSAARASTDASPRPRAKE